MKLRDYQSEAISQVRNILYKYGVCYLAGEVRTGKTLVALHVAGPYSKDGTVLFVTKKLAISSIVHDIEKADIKVLGRPLDIVVINYEKLQKVDFTPSFIIYDEAHNLGQFPKPAKKTINARKRFARIPTLFLSGTPSPESYCQLFHQFWVTGMGPWTKYTKFYEWARDHVNVKQKFVGAGNKVNDYSEARPNVMQEFAPYRVSMSQEDAGFDGKVIDVIHYIEMPDIVDKYLKALKKSRVYGNLVADTGARLMAFIHQICSGTVINNDGERERISEHKVEYIRQKFLKKGKRVAIFYCYVEEGEMLKDRFMCTNDPIEFKNAPNKVFISQVVRGREGINLSIADEIIFLNISYSAVSYWQARARSQSIDGGDKHVHWLFTKGGIEEDIFNTIKLKKCNFTLNHFRKIYGTKKARIVSTI